MSSDGQVFTSFAEMLADIERNMTTWDRIRRAYCSLGDARRSVRFAYQRVVRGWDDLSVWSVRDSLPKTLGAQLVKMAEIAHGCPGTYLEDGFDPMDADPGDVAFDRWVADLRTHGEALLAFSRDEDESDATYEAAQESLRWVADNLWSLWD